MRTFGKTPLRGAGATGFLAMIGLAAALVPLAIHSLFTGQEPPGMLLYFAASMIAGGVVGRVLRR
jgi:predicted PurR-regulated permease PerM